MHKHISHPTNTHALTIQSQILALGLDTDTLEDQVEGCLIAILTTPLPLQQKKSLLEQLLNPEPFYSNELAYNTLCESVLTTLDHIHQAKPILTTIQSPTANQIITYLTNRIYHSQLTTKKDLYTLIGNYVASPLLTDTERSRFLTQIPKFIKDPLPIIQHLLNGYFSPHKSNDLAPLPYVVFSFMSELIPQALTSPQDTVSQLLQILKYIPFNAEQENHYTDQLLTHIKQKPIPRQIRQIAHLLLYSFSKNPDHPFSMHLLRKCLDYTDSQSTTESLKIHIRSHHKELARLTPLQEHIAPQKTLKRKRSIINKP